MRDNNDELLPLVDEEGRTLGCARRGDLHNGHDMRLHPVVHLHVLNEAGHVYLQRRPLWKTVQPGKWDTAVGGHMDCDETPLQALLRETKEEIGLTDFQPAFLLRYTHQSNVERELVYVYTTVTAEQPRPSAELDGGRFFSPEEISRLMGTDFFTPNFEQEWMRIQPLLHPAPPSTTAL